MLPLGKVNQSNFLDSVVNEVVKEARIKKAIDFPTEEAMKKYLHDHPDADPSNHKVVKTEEKVPVKAEGKEDFSKKIEEKKKELNKHFDGVAERGKDSNGSHSEKVVDYLMFENPLNINFQKKKLSPKDLKKVEDFADGYAKKNGITIDKKDLFTELENEHGAQFD